MIHEVTMPAMGADMTEGTVVKWLKSEGDEVARGDKLAEIETDKTVVEMEAYNAGILRRIVLGDGTKAPVGSLLAYIGAADDVLPEADDPPAAAPVEEPDEPEPAVELQVETVAPEPQPAPESVAPAPVAATPSAPMVEGGRIKASPLARRLARESGYDLVAIPGTGPGGRITRDDVLGFTPAPAFAPSGVAAAPTAVTVDGSDIELTTMRQAIARVTVRSKTEAPHYYVTSGVDMTEAMSFRAQLNA
ncbi:MAG: dihydrolipoamide acetyltransferase, partial [Chloroflexi bacterium]|nr:dihydrolipoamide acetyltransferase [Chloroflexota bacterium]